MKILFIGSRLYDDVDWYVKQKNITSILTESNEDAINLELPDEVFIVPRGMDGPKQIALLNNVDAIIPLIGIDPPLIDVAYMKEEIEKEHNIPVIAANIKAIELTSDKIKTKDFFTRININTPNFQVIKSSSDLTLNFPVVLKQSEGQGGKDILIANSIKDVDDYLANFNQALCEEFIEGFEISLEVLSFNGECVSLMPIYKGKTTLDATHPLAKIRKTPCLVDGLDNIYLQKTARDIVVNLDSDGVFEVEFIYSTKNNRLYAIEVNARPNGIRYLTEASSSINSLCELVNMATGEFSVNNILDKMNYYHSIEIPIGNYEGDIGNTPYKSFKNNYFIVHGPENYQRITIRANSKEELEKHVNDLS